MTQNYQAGFSHVLSDIEKCLVSCISSGVAASVGLDADTICKTCTLQAHPNVPVVENLEDLWMVSKLQRERKAKQKAAKERRLFQLQVRNVYFYEPASTCDNAFCISPSHNTQHVGSIAIFVHL